MKSKLHNKTASELHENVPPDWYFASMKRNLLQRYWHTRRFAEVKKLASVVDGKVLDIGSADGVFSKVILDATQAKQLIGIDVLKTSVDWANNHWRSNKKMKFMVGDAHKLNFPDNTFDAVFALEVLEHVFDPGVVFAEVRRVLKRNGYAIFLVPTDNFLFTLIWGFITRFWWARIWKDTHVQSFSKTNTLADAVRRSGLEVEVDKRFILGMLNIIKVRKV